MPTVLSAPPCAAPPSLPLSFPNFLFSFVKVGSETL